MSGFLKTLAAPARRALEREGLTTVTALSTRREADILALHGIGPSSLPALRAALHTKGLDFKR